MAVHILFALKFFSKRFLTYAESAKLCPIEDEQREFTSIFILGGQGALDQASNLEAKFGARSANKKKNLGSSGNTRGKTWDRIPGKRILYYLFRCF